MTDYTAAQLAQIGPGAAGFRDFIWFEVKNRDTGAPFTQGYWNDLGAYVDAPVDDPTAGGIVNRTYQGAGQLVTVSPFSEVIGLTAQTITVELSQVRDDVLNMLQGYQAKQGKVQFHQAVFNPNTLRIVDHALLMFSGYIDRVNVQTPRAGDTGSVSIECISDTQEAMRSYTGTRSDADQKLRNPNDNFYQHAASVGTWEIFWGQAQE